METWHEYLEEFAYFRDAVIRPGCQPRVARSPFNRNAVVLIHGLTDSPHYLDAVGRHLSARGCDVLLPLLQGHGLEDPQGMAGVSLAEWKRNVDYAVAAAASHGKRVSIGGLSTGGALAVHRALTEPEVVSGAVFLFSAALGLAGRAGDMVERLLRTRAAGVVDRLADRLGRSLVGAHPYRYARMDLGGASELAHLIGELDRLTEEGGLEQPLFVAHSAADTVAAIAGVEALVARSPAGRTSFHRVDAGLGVGHASLVLAADVLAPDGILLESANPCFEHLLEAMDAFVHEHLGWP